MSAGPPLKPGLRSLRPSALWRLDPDDYTGLRRRLIRALQMVTLVARDFWNDQCLLHASSLTFSTLFAIVPFFALAFALLKGVGVPNRLEPFILEQVTAGSQETVGRIISFINNTSMSSLGTAGLIALTLTLLSLLLGIEEAFNAIWGVTENRALVRKIRDYLAVLVSAPILMLVAVTLTTFLENRTIVGWLVERKYLGDLLLTTLKLATYVSAWVALTFLYLVIPNTKVRFSSAVIGGILAGTTWEIAQWCYITFQVGVSRYNAIYGTLSLLPIFMIWIYTSWIIVLLGVEVVYAHQNRRTLRLECHGEPLSHEARRELALTLLVECVVSFRRGTLLSEEQMAAELSLPVRQVKQSLGELERSGLLARLAGDSPGWHPAQEPAKLSVSEVMQRLETAGSSCLLPEASRCEELVRKVLALASSGAATALEGVTLGALADLLEPDAPADEADRPAVMPGPHPDR